MLLPSPCGHVTCDLSTHFCNYGYVEPQCDSCSRHCAGRHIRGNTPAVQDCIKKCSVYMYKEAVKETAIKSADLPTFNPLVPTIETGQAACTCTCGTHCFIVVGVACFLILTLLFYIIYYLTRKREKNVGRKESVESSTCSDSVLKPAFGVCSDGCCFPHPSSEFDNTQGVEMTDLGRDQASPQSAEPLLNQNQPPSGIEDCQQEPNQPASHPHITNQPAPHPHSTSQPASHPHSTNQPASHPHSTNQPASHPHITNQPAPHPHITNQPAAPQHSNNQPAAHQHSTNQPAAHQHSNNQPAAHQHSNNNPAAVHHPMATIHPSSSQFEDATSPKQSSYLMAQSTGHDLSDSTTSTPFLSSPLELISSTDSFRSRTPCQPQSAISNSSEQQIPKPYTSPIQETRH